MRVSENNEDWAKEVELMQSGFCTCEHCGEVTAEGKGFASASTGWLCFSCYEKAAA
jgi:formylmethanofuran dehydrogenase subunit E